MPGGLWGIETFHGQLGAETPEKTPKPLMSAELGQYSVLLAGLHGNLFTQRNKASDKLCVENSHDSQSKFCS